MFDGDSTFERILVRDIYFLGVVNIPIFKLGLPNNLFHI